MRIKILTLVAMLLTVPMARAQIDSFPACSLQQLSLADELIVEYETLIDRAQAIESLDDLLRYGAAQLAWRDATWKQVPICAEMHRLGRTLIEISDGFAAAHSLDFAGIDHKDNPYQSLLASGAEAAQIVRNRIDNAIKTAGETHPPEGSLPDCTDLERRFLNYFVVPGFEPFIKSNFSANSQSDTLDYVAAQLEWREQLWSSLPLCREAYELGATMFNFVNDFAMVQILDQIGVSISEIIYVDSALKNLSNFEELLKWMSDGPAYFRLPSCSETALYQPHFKVFQQHADLYDLPKVIEEDLLAFTEAHFRWRDSLLALLPSYPACGEALEFALLTIQLSSDSVTTATLQQSEFGAPELALLYEQRNTEARQRISELTTVLGSMETSQTFSNDTRLPTCSATEFDATNESMRKFSDLINLSQLIEEDSNLSSQISAVLEWRDELQMTLPLCSPAFEFALLMIGALGDANSAQALVLAGVADTDNPFPQQITAYMRELARLWEEEVVPLRQSAYGD